MARATPGDSVFLPGPSVEEALMATRALLEVIYDRKSEVGFFNIESQISAYQIMSSWPEDKFVPYMKYVTTYPMAKFLENELPEKPDGFVWNPLVFSGQLRRFLKNRLHDKRSKNASFWMSYLQGVKRACAKAPGSIVHQSFLKHRRALTKNPKVEPDHFEWFGSYLGRFWKGFKAASPKLHEASPSASYEYKRSQGGQREFIRRHFEESEEEPGQTVFTNTQSVTDWLEEVRRDFPELNLSDDQIDLLDWSERDYNRLYPDDDLIEFIETRPGEVESFRGAVPVRNYQDYLYTLWDEYQTGRLGSEVMVSAVIEPLKIRLVTKGESFKYHLSKWFQKQMWGYLQKYPQFSLTGTPLTANHIYDLLERETKLGLNHIFDMWVSGDYSAATDNIKLPYTKAAFESALRRSKISPREKILLREVLYEQQLNYPQYTMRKYAKDGDDLSTVLQSDGQLMGSPLSFPILCTVNLVGYWMALERYTGLRCELSELPVLVNGDDILFRCNQALYELWIKIVRDLGFELSVGKNYVHKRYFTINSQLLSYENGRIKWLEYFNVGLLTGQSKLTARVGESQLPIWDYYNIAIAGANNKLRAHNRFLHYHKDTLSSMTDAGEQNLFIHPLMGGLGFDLYESVREKVHMTPWQYKIALITRSRLLAPFEGQFEKDPLIKKLSDINKTVIPTVKRYHHGRYVRIPTYQPLMKGQREVIRLEDVIEPLSYSQNYTEKPELHYKRSALGSRLIKSIRHSRMEFSKDSFELKDRFNRFDFRLVEEVSTSC